MPIRSNGRGDRRLIDHCPDCQRFIGTRVQLANHLQHCDSYNQKVQHLDRLNQYRQADENNGDVFQLNDGGGGNGFLDSDDEDSSYGGGNCYSSGPASVNGAFVYGNNQTNHHCVVIDVANIGGSAGSLNELGQAVAEDVQGTRVDSLDIFGGIESLADLRSLDSIDALPGHEDQSRISLPQGPSSQVGRFFGLNPARYDESTKTFIFDAEQTRRVFVHGLPSDHSVLELLRVLDNARCPRNLYNSIIKWCRYTRQLRISPGDTTFVGRDSFVSGLAKRAANANITVPTFHLKTVNLKTIHGKQPVCVPTWDFEMQLRSLLSDMTIFGNPDNLCLNEECPFLPVKDINKTGKWYQDTIKDRQITGYDGRFLVPIVFAIDKTGTTDNQRFGLEPLLFTTTLIKRDLWEYPHAWRPIGLVPCIEDAIGQAKGSLARGRKESRDNSTANYHACLEAILESVYKAQQSFMRHDRDFEDHSICGGVNCEISLGTVKRVMQVVCPVSHILVDGEGADKQTGRDKSTKTIDNPRISRSCFCRPGREASNPFVKCTPLVMEDIWSAFQEIIALEEGSEERKEKLSQFRNLFALHPVFNAWWKCDFGSNRGGVYGACKVDPMHALDEGIIQYLLTEVLGSTQQNSTKRMMIDKIAQELFRDAPRQRARARFPRVSFNRGITTLTFLAAHEWVGLLFYSTVIANMDYKNRRQTLLCRNVSYDGQINERWVFLQIMTLFRSWIDYGPFECLYQEEENDEDESATPMLAEKVDASVRKICAFLQTVIYRDSGENWNLQKIHDAFVHLVRDIFLCGNSRNVNTGVSEKMHKFYCKLPAETAIQHTQDKFHISVANRICEAQFLTQCRSLYDMPDCVLTQEELLLNHARSVILKDLSSSDKSGDDILDDHQDNRASIKNGAIGYAALTSHKKFQVTWTLQTRRNCQSHPFLKQSIERLFNRMTSAVDDDSNRLLLYGECKIGEDVILRAHPDYQSAGPWYDWALVEWSDTWPRNHGRVPVVDCWHPLLETKKGRKREVLNRIDDHVEGNHERNAIPEKEGDVTYYVPAKVLCFYKKKNDGIHAVIHTCDTVCQTNSLISRRWKLFHKSTKVLSIPISSVVCPVYVVEEKPGFHEDSRSGRNGNDFFTSVHEIFDRRTSWGRQFLNIVASESFDDYIPKKCLYRNGDSWGNVDSDFDMGHSETDSDDEDGTEDEEEPSDVDERAVGTDDEGDDNSGEESCAAVRKRKRE